MSHTLSSLEETRLKRQSTALMRFFRAGAEGTGELITRVGKSLYDNLTKLGVAAATAGIVLASIAPAAQAHQRDSVFDNSAVMAQVLDERQAAMNDANVKRANELLEPMERAVKAAPMDPMFEVPLPSDTIYPQGELGDQMRMSDIVKDIYPLQDGGKLNLDQERLLEVQKKIFDLTFDTVDVVPDVSRLYGAFKGHNIAVQALITKGVENWTEDDRVQFDQIEESVTALHQVRAPEMLRTDHSSEKPFNLQGQVDLHEAERKMVPHLQVHLIRLDVQILGGGLHDSTTPHVMLKKQLDVLDQIAEAESFTSHHAEIVRKIADETGFGGPDNDVPSQIRADFVDEPTSPKM